MANNSAMYSAADLLMDIECPVCFDIPKDPKTLPCFHTFCLKCLQKFFAKCTETAASCPMCRKEFIVPPDGVESLRCHPTVSRLLELESARVGMPEQKENLATATTEETIPDDTVIIGNDEEAFEMVNLSENSTEIGQSAIAAGAAPKGEATLEEIKDWDCPSLITIKRAALGAYATFGDLYDATTDSFTGVSILRDDMKGKTKITPVDPENRKWTMTAVDPYNVKDRMTRLDMCREMQLSVLAGLVQTRGHAEYLANRAWSAIDNKKIHGALVCTMITAERGIGVTDASLGQWLSLQSAAEVKPATHVVVGIECGVRIVISLAAEVKEGESIDNQKYEFNTVLNQFASSFNEFGSFITEAAEKFQMLLRGCAFSLFADVNFDNWSGVTNLNEAIAILNRMASFQNANSDGMCFPLQYILLPLSNLPNFVKASRVIGNYENRILDDTSSIAADLASQMDQLDSLKILNAKFLDQFKKNTLYISEDMIAETDKVNNTIQIVQRWQERVKAALVSVRLGQQQLKILSDYSQIAITNRWTEILSEFLNEIAETNDRISFIRSLEGLGVLFVGKNKNVSDIRKDHGLTKFYVFLFEYSKTSPTFRQNRDLFRLLLENVSCTPDDSKPSYIAAASRQSVQIRGLAVDTDLCPNHHLDERLPSGTRICLYSNGSYILHDVLNEIQNDGRKNIAKSTVDRKEIKTRPLKYAYAEWPCPNSFDGTCPQNSLRWLCENCKEILEYDFHLKTIYCSCGSAPYQDFIYKCNSDMHCNELTSFKGSTLDDIIGNLKPIQCTNILILGETGVGKSTWINGIVNYATFPSLDEASKSEQVYVIPTSFSVQDPETYEEKKIFVGKSSADDEHFATEGQSSTQEPRAYRFQYADKHIRLIDTPGIGDTRGISHDKINCEKILTYLSQIDKLHGICILLKPNNARLTISFRFCLEELLTHLHVDASKNIVFCFTNSRASFYTPGDTFVPLKQYLSNVRGMQSVDLAKPKGNLYCFDNESFRYLCTIHSGIPLNNLQVSCYRDSWEQSVSETSRLLDNISNRTPHELINTVSLNAARNIINTLSEPLANISLNIEQNIKVIERKVKQIQTYDAEEENLNAKLMIKVTDLVARDVEYPRMVCTSGKCTSTKTSPVTGEKQNIYTVCHSPCNLAGVEAKKFPNPMLLKCALIRKDLTCDHCECQWDCHMHITYVYEKVEKIIRDSTVEKLIQSGEDQKNQIQAAIESGKEKMKELQEELEKIACCCAKFGAFLSANSIAPYNDAFDEYILHLIELEKRVSDIDGDRSKLDNLDRMRRIYKEHVNIIKQAMESENRSPIEIEDVYKLKEELEQLPHNGQQLKQILEVAAAASAKHKLRRETFYNANATAYARAQEEKKVKIIESLRDTFKERLVKNQEERCVGSIHISSA